MTRLTIKTIRVMGPSHMEFPSNKAFDDANQEVVDNLDWGLVEDSVNDQLPDGYYAKLEDS